MSEKTGVQHLMPSIAEHDVDAANTQHGGWADVQRNAAAHRAGEDDAPVLQRSDLGLGLDGPSELTAATQSQGDMLADPSGTACGQ